MRSQYLLRYGTYKNTQWETKEVPAECESDAIAKVERELAAVQRFREMNLPALTGGVSSIVQASLDPPPVALGT
jgi:hypothetical protein